MTVKPILVADIYDKTILLRCKQLHHTVSDLINNMDQMGISGTEPSSVILSQTKKSNKLKSEWFPQKPQLNYNKGLCNTSQNYNFNHCFKTSKRFILSKRYKSVEVSHWIGCT